MRWVAPAARDAATTTMEKRLWEAADQLRANSGLKSQEYSTPVLGLIFRRFADVRFAAHRAKLAKQSASSRRGSLVDKPGSYHSAGVLYLPEEARFDYLLGLPEGEKVGNRVTDAMRAIEKHNTEQVGGVLPKEYNRFSQYGAGSAEGGDPGTARGDGPRQPHARGFC